MVHEWKVCENERMETVIDVLTNTNWLTYTQTLTSREFRISNAKIECMHACMVPESVHIQHICCTNTVHTVANSVGSHDGWVCTCAEWVLTTGRQRFSTATPLLTHLACVFWMKSKITKHNSRQQLRFSGKVKILLFIYRNRSLHLRLQFISRQIIK